VAALIVLGTDAEQWDLGACRLNERASSQRRMSIDELTGGSSEIVPLIA
jgi:hypothetical protein